MEDEIKSAKKEYVKLLSFCRPDVDEYPIDLLKRLDEARDKWVKLKQTINQ